MTIIFYPLFETIAKENKLASNNQDNHWVAMVNHQNFLILDIQRFIEEGFLFAFDKFDIYDLIS